MLKQEEETAKKKKLIIKKCYLSNVCYAFKKNIKKK